jgi:Ca2+-binding EF-hand superfamily protein
MDQDGFLSLREAAVSRYLLENFYTIDLNEDGLISKEEFSYMLRSKA